MLSGAPEDPQDDTVMEKHGAKALDSAVRCFMHVIRTEDEHAEQDAAHQMFQIAKPWTMRRWSVWDLANAKPLVRILKENAHLVDFKWTEEEQA